MFFENLNISIVCVVSIYGLFYLFSGSTSTFSQLHLDRVDCKYFYLDRVISCVIRVDWMQ